MRSTVCYIAVILLFASNLLGQGVTFSSPGGPYNYSVPSGVTMLCIDMSGAQGGNPCPPGYSAQGGKGGRVQCALSVTPGEVLYVYVGGHGGYTGTSTGTPGGFNGGGTGGAPNGSGGGGASDIRTDTNLTSRLVVAGGGGGCDCYCAGDRGGAGGDPGITGEILCGPPGYSGSGADSAGPGWAYAPTGGVVTGSLGIGANAYCCLNGGGGGGGYYGGGGSYYGSGGGGSSYAPGPGVTHGALYTTGHQSGNGYVSITTVPPPMVSGIMSTVSDVCVGDSITLTDSTAGGSWSASNGNGTVSGGVVSGISGGTDIISYTITHSCASISAIHTITVNPLPSVAEITDTSTVVCTELPILLKDTTLGGIWSATNTDASVSGGFVTGITPGIDTIRYTVTNSCGTASVDIVITVDSCSSASVSTLSQTGILVFPNPTRNYIVISNSEPIREVLINDLLGKAVFTESYNNNHVRVNLDNLPSSVYFVRVNGSYVSILTKE